MAETEIAPSPRDFASIAEQLTKIEMPADGSDPKLPSQQVQQKQPVQQQPAKITTDPKRVPDELFGGKKEEKPSDKPPESDFDKIVDPTFQDPKRKADWDGVKSKGREWEKKAIENERKATELQAKIAEYEAKGKDSEALTAKLAAMEKEHGEWKALVQKVNIELDPEFRSVYVEGRNKLINHAKTIIEESSLNPKDVEIALNLQGKARVEALKALTDEMDGFQQGRLGNVVDKLTELDQAAEAKRSNPEEYFNQAAKRRQDQDEQFRRDAVVKANVAYDTALKRTAADLEVLRPVEGLDWWNDQGKQIQERARDTFLSNNDPQVAATVCLRAEAMPIYRQLFIDQRDQNTKLTKELEEKTTELKKLYGNGSPSLRGTALTHKDGASKNFADHATSLMTGQ